MFICNSNIHRTAYVTWIQPVHALSCLDPYYTICSYKKKPVPPISHLYRDVHAHYPITVRAFQNSISRFFKPLHQNQVIRAISDFSSAFS